MDVCENGHLERYNYQSSIMKLILKRSREGIFCPQILVAALPGLRDYFCNIPLSESSKGYDSKGTRPHQIGRQQTLATTITKQKRIGERCLSLVLNQRPRVHMEAENIAQSQNKYLPGLQSRYTIPAWICSLSSNCRGRNGFLFLGEKLQQHSL